MHTRKKFKYAPVTRKEAKSEWTWLDPPEWQSLFIDTSSTGIDVLGGQQVKFPVCTPGKYARLEEAYRNGYEILSTY